MAKSTTTLGVEMVDQEVRLVLVERSEQGISVVAAQTARATDDLARICRSLPRRSSAAVCAVSLEDAAIRILSLPPTTEENLTRVVALEAETALPLGADELALAHHVLGMTEQSRMEVLLAGARQSSVQTALRRANCAPWISASATVSAMALLNALEQLRGTAREAVCAVLRVEEHQSELVILERNRVLVAQSIPMGYATAPEPVLLGEPAAVAAGGPGGGAPFPSLAAAPLAWPAVLAQQVRYPLQAVCYERGISIERLYLCGKGAAQPDADWQLSEQFELPVALLSPDEKNPADGAAYAVAYGCAVQAAGAATIALNLAMPRVTVAREVEQRRQAQRSWLALAGATALATGLIFGAIIHSEREAVRQAEVRLQQLGVPVEESAMSPADLNKALASVTTAGAARVPAATALSALSANLPAGTWLTELTYNSASGCVFRGYSLDETAPQQAQIALLDRQLFDEVTLDYRTGDEIGDVPVWGFQISCKLRPAVVDRRRGGTRR